LLGIDVTLSDDSLLILWIRDCSIFAVSAWNVAPKRMFLESAFCFFGGLARTQAGMVGE